MHKNSTKKYFSSLVNVQVGVGTGFGLIFLSPGTSGMSSLFGGFGGEGGKGGLAAVKPCLGALLLFSQKAKDSSLERACIISWATRDSGLGAPGGNI